MRLTSQTSMAISSISASIAATALNITGASGSIGGEGVISYVKNLFATSATFGEGVTAPSFTGDLNGRAKEAINAEFATTLAGAPQSWTIDETATNSEADGTSAATSDSMESSLAGEDNGIRRVQVDPGNYIYNSINRSANNGV
jgi:hypothetical protein